MKEDLIQDAEFSTDMTSVRPSAYVNHHEIIEVERANAECSVGQQKTRFNDLTLILGQSKILSSLVTVPTITMILPSLPDFFICLAILAMDTGGLLILDMKRRRRMMRLNLASVRRAKKRYNLNPNGATS